MTNCGDCGGVGGGHQVLRIETKQAPRPSKAEVVLSDGQYPLTPSTLVTITPSTLVTSTQLGGVIIRTHLQSCAGKTMFTYVRFEVG